MPTLGSDCCQFCAYVVVVAHVQVQQVLVAGCRRVERSLILRGVALGLRDLGQHLVPLGRDLLLLRLERGHELREPYSTGTVVGTVQTQVRRGGRLRPENEARRRWW